MNKNTFFFTSLVALFVSSFILNIFGSYYVYIYILVSYYIVLAGSWNLIAGYTGQLSFGQPALLAIGGYSSAIITKYFPHFLSYSILLGGIFSLIVGLLLGLVSLRLKGIYFALSSFGFTIVVYYLILAQYNFTGGYEGMPTQFLLSASPYRQTLAYYFVSAAIMVSFLVSSKLVVDSKFGLFMQSIKENEEAAKMNGVNSTFIKLITFALSSFWTGVCGSFFVHLVGYASPSLASLDVMATIIFISVIGGLGKFYGPIIGSLIVIPLSQTLTVYTSSYNTLLFAAIVIIILKFARDGVAGLIEKIKI